MDKLKQVRYHDRESLRQILRYAGITSSSVCPGCGEQSKHLVLDHWRTDDSIFGMLICYHCNIRIGNHPLLSVSSRLQYLISPRLKPYSMPISVSISIFEKFGYCSLCNNYSYLTPTLDRFIDPHTLLGRPLCSRCSKLFSRSRSNQLAINRILSPNPKATDIDNLVIENFSTRSLGNINKLLEALHE